MSKELPANPDFKAIEEKWKNFWLKNKIYKFDKKSKKPVYSIDTPPPTISGRLHMGHILNYTLFDFVARYKRMRGFNLLFPIGFDDNGQPTERFVEKKLGIQSKNMDRQEFNKIVFREIPEAENITRSDLLQMGYSYDWDFFYQTISPESTKIAQKSFLDLYKKKFLYQKAEPVLWCTSCQTALSQADAEDETRSTKLNYVDFILEDGSKLNIATTRPELLPACVGIFVNPQDGRYSNLIGKKAKVPLFDYWVEIRADEKVDKEFGTGAVMICTFGDKTDVEWWKKHKLDLKICITRDGKINHLGKKYAGLNLKEAREAILDDLEGNGLLTKQEPLEQNVGACWRCGTPIEFIVAKQWFVKILPFKKQLLAQGRKVKWHPEYYSKRYEDWVKNLSWDWIISRQRHFGPQIPAWYCKKCGEVILPDEKDLPIDPEKDKPKKCKCGSSEFEPEHDVFDTWMTSSLTPELVVGFSGKNLPMSLRSSGQDIIRTWAFYTILKAYYHFKKLPWTDAMINGMAQYKGKAMHKSKGDVIAPQDMIAKYNVEALRFWTASYTLGEDVPFEEKELDHACRLMTKLWNISRFVALQLKSKTRNAKLSPMDKWMLANLNSRITSITRHWEQYEFNYALREAEDLLWKVLADNYIEVVKHRLYGEKSADGARLILHQTLLAIVKMLAPILPFVTEEIYQNLFAKAEKVKSVHLSAWPKAGKANKKDLALGNLAIEAISEIRKYKQGKNMSLGAELEKLVLASPKAKELEKVKDEIAGTMRIKKLEIKPGKQLAIL